MQINMELWSAYLYLSMSLDAREKGLKGVAHWFRHHCDEEMQHAFKFMRYMEGQMAKVRLFPIAEVPVAWDSPSSMFAHALQHEQKITSYIHHIYALAQDERDYATSGFLQWFVDEQIEEEETVSEKLSVFKCLAADKAALFMYDNQLKEEKS